MRVSVRLFMVACLFVLGVFTSVSSKGALPDTLVLGQGYDQYAVGKKLFLYEDKEGDQSLEQVLHLHSLFLPALQEIPVFGSTRSAIWSRFTVSNSSQDKNWHLKIGNPYLEEVSLYQETAAGTFSRIDIGREVPYSKRALKTSEILVPLALAPGESATFFLRVQSDLIVRFPLTIASLPALYEQSRQELLINGLYYGLILALLAYNLFVFISGGDRSYLYYVLYILFLGLNTAFIDGYTFAYLPESLSRLNNTLVFSSLAYLFALLFTNSFLQIRRSHRLLQFYSLLLYSTIIIGLGLYCLDNFFIAFRLTLGLSVLFIPYVFYAGATSLKEGFKPALYYLAGFGFLAAGVAVYALKDTAILPAIDFTENAMKIGSAFEMIVLSFALARKFTLYKQQKEQLQEQALEQANHFTYRLIEKQESERKRIASELHDSVGQHLILAKSKIMLLSKAQADKNLSHELDAVKAMLSDTVEEVRAISYALRPPQLDLLGLTQAIVSMAEDVGYISKTAFNLECQNIDGLFSKEHEINIYRIVQECLNNIVKHAEATAASISISRKSQDVSIIIKDNGRGCHTTTLSLDKHSGFGLSGIRERVNLLKGFFQLVDNVPTGTAISIVIPFTIGDQTTQDSNVLTPTA